MPWINYEVENYCSNCDLKWPKIIRRCKKCNFLIRRKAIRTYESKVVRI